MIILNDINIKHSGRYKAIVHNGRGTTFRESPWSDNLILNAGLAQLAQNVQTTIFMVCGAGNTPVQPTDGVLSSFLGRASSGISITNVMNSTPDAEGYVTIKDTYRYQFAPGSMGGGNKNVSEAGMAYGTTSPTASTPLLSRGLLVDDMGDPASVAVNNDEEYLDLLWEHTTYVPAEVSTVVSLTIDGVATNHTITVRPCLFKTPQDLNWPFTTINYIWGASTPSYGNGINQQSMTSLYTGNIGELTNFPGGYVGYSAAPSSTTLDPYVAGSYARTFKLTWSPTQGNIGVGTGGAKSMVVILNTSRKCFQIGFNPALQKISTKQLDLYFRFAFANKS